MNSQQTREFARRLMREVWEPFDYTAVERFYNRDVRGHNRSQELVYDDVVHRLRSDTGRFADPLYDIKDIIVSEEKFAIRFIYTATVVATGEPVETGRGGVADPPPSASARNCGCTRTGPWSSPSSCAVYAMRTRVELKRY